MCKETLCGSSFFLATQANEIQLIAPFFAASHSKNLANERAVKKNDM